MQPKLRLLLTTFADSLLMVLRLPAQARTSEAFVTTDKLDYLQGDILITTGSGFPGNEIGTLQVYYEGKPGIMLSAVDIFHGT